MAEIVVLLIFMAIFIVLLTGSVWGLSRDHPTEVFTIWYAFSLLFVIFFALYLIADTTKRDVTEIFGPTYTELFKTIFDEMTNLSAEIKLVAVGVYVSVLPQLLAYFLSGFSGSAKAPKYVDWIGKIAIWSIIKFLAALSGIVFARYSVEYLFFTPLSNIQDLKNSLIFVVISFVLANLQHDYFDGKFVLKLIPGLSVRLRVPALVSLHEFFRRNDAKHDAIDSTGAFPGIEVETLARLYEILEKSNAKRKIGEAIKTSPGVDVGLESEFRLFCVVVYPSGFLASAIGSWLHKSRRQNAKT